MSNLSRFNAQFENMLNDLLILFPDNKELKIFREKFMIAKSTNAKMILLIFLKYIYPYKQKIMNKDEKFIMSNDLMDELKNNKNIQKEVNVDSEYIITKALNIKNLWIKMNENDRETLWKYFQVLIILCERYVNESMKS
jgi:hypothetical protein